MLPDNVAQITLKMPALEYHKQIMVRDSGECPEDQDTDTNTGFKY